MGTLQHLGEPEQGHVHLRLRDQFHVVLVHHNALSHPLNTEENYSGEGNASYTLDPNHQQAVYHS